MCYKQHLLSTFILLLISSTTMATPICTREAIEKANNQYLQDISSLTSQFANAKNHAAVADLSKIKPTTAFKKKHKQEIKQLNNPSYQPSQAFCDDLYTNLADLKKQVRKVVNKYQIKSPK